MLVMILRVKESRLQSFCFTAGIITEKLKHSLPQTLRCKFSIAVAFINNAGRRMLVYSLSGCSLNCGNRISRNNCTWYCMVFCYFVRCSRILALSTFWSSILPIPKIVPQKKLSLLIIALAILGCKRILVGFRIPQLRKEIFLAKMEPFTLDPQMSLVCEQTVQRRAQCIGEVCMILFFAGQQEDFTMSVDLSCFMSLIFEILII